MRKYIVGNWKMNGTSGDLAEIGRIIESAAKFGNVDSALCIPATLIDRATARYSGYPIGGQDCHMTINGAHTGCISAEMLKDAGATLTIIGHSERRAAQGESDSDICAKALAAKTQGLVTIVCVGETESERLAGNAESIVLAQLAGSVPDEASGEWLCVAYEPIWAIGTGRIPTEIDVAQMHSAIRNALIGRFGEVGKDFRILYGGSMNCENANNILNIDNVDGGLIGGASLSAEKFMPILAAAN
jgi:triosephosphate isomerase (TIM)